MNDFEYIEQLLKPQCEFKASDTLKQKVMEEARQEVKPRRIVRMWPWLAAACVIGFVMMILMPPRHALEEQPLVAKVETPNEREQSGTCSSYAERGGVGQRQTPKVVEEQPVESTSDSINIRVETPQQPKVRKSRPTVKEEFKEEPVEMSEQTRKALLLARIETDMPQMETIDPEEEIRQIRMRGERLISMYEENDK